MDVQVTFDPCSLREHDWRSSEYAIGRAFGAVCCRRCGVTRFPDDGKIGGLDRSENKLWRAYQRG